MTPLRSRLGLLLAATLAAPAWSAPPQKKAADKQPVSVPAPTGVAVSSDTPVSLLSQQLSSNIAAQEDAASRFARFLLSKSSAQAYIADSVKADADAVKRLNALPIVWVKKKVEAKKPGDAAMLYFVMGEDLRLGGWANSYPLLKSVMDRGTERAKLLDTAMELYTADRDKALKDNPALRLSYVGPYKGGAKPPVDEWVFGFFDFAAERSVAILSDTRVKKEVSDSILAHEEAPSVPAVGDRKNRVDQAVDSSPWGARVSAFDYAGCYERGSVTAYVPVGGGGNRRISIKIFTVIEGGAPVNKVGVFDISEPGTPPDRVDSKIFGQMFPLNQSGESTFRLDDRKPDGAMYKLSMGSNGSISFGAPDGDPQIKTSLSDLLGMRKLQVEREGVLDSVNGVNYRVIGQGGFRGGWLYFPVDANGALTGEAAGSRPTLVVETSQVGPDGRTERISGPRPLGFVGKGAAGTPQFFYLAWNDDKAFYEPKTCDDLKARCDFPVEPKKKKADKGKDDKGEKGGKGGKDKEEAGAGAGDGGEVADEEGGAGADVAEGGGDDGHGVETSSAFSRTCGIKATDFRGGGFLEKKMNKWTYFMSQTKESGNSSQVCMNDAKRHTFVVQGIIANIDIVPGNEVVVETFSPESFIDPTYLASGWKVVNNEIVASGHKFKISGHYIFYIPLANLHPDSWGAVSDQGMASIDKAARVKLDVDVMNKDLVKKMNVFLRNTSQASKNVSDALAKHAKDSPLRNDPHKAKLLAYIQGEIAKDKGAKIEPDAFVSIVLYLSSELGNTGSEAGGTDNYKEIVPYIYLAKDSSKHNDKLVYCGVVKGLETLTDHAKNGHVPK